VSIASYKNILFVDFENSQQIPLDLEVEAFFVANDLSVGASTFFIVRADRRQANNSLERDAAKPRASG
jgi:hypothetical protein